MGEFKELVKSGEIFLAPNVEPQAPYLIKCLLCDEYWNQFDDFLAHHRTHYVDEERPSDISKSATVLGDVLNNLNENEETSEDATDLNKMDNLHTEENGNVEDKTSECGLPSAAVQSFMESKDNVLKLINAYKNYPVLWELNMTRKYNIRKLQVNGLHQIAREFNTNGSQNMSYQHLVEIIVYLRKHFKEYYEHRLSNDISKTASHNFWFIEHMNFLRPYMEDQKKSEVAEFSFNPTSTEFIKIMDIYQKFSNLWNTNCIEYYCINKRSEAEQQMMDLINSEMKLNINIITLRKYLLDLNQQFTQEKRKFMASQQLSARTQHFPHTDFLYDHLPPFVCTECKKSFKSLLYLKSHASTHDGKLHLSCPLCHQDFKYVELYVFHIRRHMDDLDKQCPKCDRKFLKAHELRAHMRLHTGEKPYCCDICGSSFRHASAFTVHKMFHAKKYKYFCPTCSKGFYVKRDYNIHMSTHKDQRNFDCLNCGKAFKSYSSLRQHKFTHDKDGRHTCHICNKEFQNKMYLHRHVKGHLRKTSLDPELKSKLTKICD